MPSLLEQFADSEDEAQLRRRPLRDDTEMDMTPMIDATFLLLIFFTVAAKLEPDTAVVLPPARYGKGVDPLRCVMITLGKPSGGEKADIFLADGKVGDPLVGDDESVSQQILEHVEVGQGKGFSNVMLKVEQGVIQRDVGRVANSVSLVEGMSLNLAVLETDVDE